MRHHSQLNIIFILVCFWIRFPLSYCYTQVAWSGANTEAQGQGPRIYKALSSDLIFPKVFNSTAEGQPIPNNHAPEPDVPLPVPSISQPVTAGDETHPLDMTNYVGLRHQQQQRVHMNKPLPLFVTPRTSDMSDVSDNKTSIAPVTIKNNNSFEQRENNYEMTTMQRPQPPQQQQQSLEQSVHNNVIKEEQQQQMRLRQQSFRKPSVVQSPIKQVIHHRPHNPQQQQLRHQQQMPSQNTPATGRSVNYRPAYTQLQDLITPQKYSNSNSHPVYYTQQPAAVQRLNSYRRPQQRPVQLTDRFSPGEAVASMHFVNRNKQKSNIILSNGKQPAASNVIQSYVPPKDLYSFPPNIDAKYPSPSKDPNAAVPNGKVNSYEAPASGPTIRRPMPILDTASSDDHSYKYNGPVNLDYLPPYPSNTNPDMDDSKKAPATDDAQDMDDAVGVLPASAMDMKDNGADDSDMSDHSHAHHDDKEYPTPPPGWVEEHPDSTHPPPSSDDDHDHSPPMMMMSDDHSSIPYLFDHDHHHHHDHYPTIIYDHDHDHHPPPPMTTTVPPEPAPEPRVKKYSYFYIGRKLWYIPLYFTVWFSFYVLWLIVKSIARHKVNLPNHYVNRRSLDTLEQRPDEHINQLTVKVLQYIDDFQRKYTNVNE